MRSLIARLVCRFKGHKRGRLLRAEDNGTTKIFGCPRCNREKRYPQRKSA